MSTTKCVNCKVTVFSQDGICPSCGNSTTVPSETAATADGGGEYNRYDRYAAPTTTWNMFLIVPAVLLLLYGIAQGIFLVSTFGGNFQRNVFSGAISLIALAGGLALLKAGVRSRS